MATMKNIIRSTAEYTRLYPSFRGVAVEAPSNASLYRLARSENMYRDYGAEGAAAIESIPGYRLLAELGTQINGIFPYRSYSGSESILLHAGNKLYRFSLDGLTDPKLTELATVRNAKSSGFMFGNSFYLLDGSCIRRVDEDGSVKVIGGSLDPYVPTLYIDGTAFEARNLLGEEFFEEYNVVDARSFTYGTPELKYSIIDEDLLLAGVCGIEDGYAGEVDIPGYVVIGTKRYRVAEICESAFASQKKITSVRIGEGVERVGRFAFDGCTALTVLMTPDSLTELGNVAMYGCTALTDVYLRSGIRRIGNSCFAECYGLKTVHYSADETSYAEIENATLSSTYTVVFGSADHSMRAEFPLHATAESVYGVTVNGRALNYTARSNKGIVTSVIVSLENYWDINGGLLRIHGIQPERYSNFDGTEAVGNIYTVDAINGCTLAEIFDGRVFLSGNPALPNTVFYSSRDRSGTGGPLYFGEHNYVNDGVGGYPVVSMLAVRDMLAVFKAGDDGTGSIFYHVKQATDDPLLPKVYPVSSIHSGISALGSSRSFLDEPVFLSPLGLTAIEKQQLNYERSVVSRSENVNFMLLSEDLSEAYLMPWMGYLAVCCKDRIYLADPRAAFYGATGSVQYEWFLIKGVGSYTDQSTVYRYESYSDDGDYAVRTDKPDEIFDGTVYALIKSEQVIYFSIENGSRYRLRPTEERIYTGFSPATVYASDGEHLLFGTETGEVYVFNNDLRGIPPTALSETEGFDKEEYAAYMSKRIHPSFYSFGGIAPTYLIRTERDDCDIPHLTKNTVKNSLVVKCKSYTSGSIRCAVSTDRSDYTEIAKFFDGIPDFSELDFSRLCFSGGEDVTLPFKEREKEWIEKDIELSSDELACPIGIYSVAFRYGIRGRIKRTV